MLGNANCITTQDLEHSGKGAVKAQTILVAFIDFLSFSHAQDALVNFNMRVSAHDIEIHNPWT